MDIYSPVTIAYRINLKWMKRRALYLINKYNFERIFDNEWYALIDENYDIFIIERGDKTNKNSYLYSNIVKSSCKTFPDSYIEMQGYLIALSDQNSNIVYSNSYYKKLIKRVYYEKFKIKLGIRKIYS